MSGKSKSAVLSADQVKISKRKLLVREQPQQPPQVILNRDGEAISSIEVRCSCGEQILLDCVYKEDNSTNGYSPS